MNENENCENVPHLEITEVVLIRCNIGNDSSKIQESCIYMFVINHLVN